MNSQIHKFSVEFTNGKGETFRFVGAFDPTKLNAVATRAMRSKKQPLTATAANGAIDMWVIPDDPDTPSL